MNLRKEICSEKSLKFFLFQLIMNETLPGLKLSMSKTTILFNNKTKTILRNRLTLKYLVLTIIIQNRKKLLYRAWIIFEKMSPKSGKMNGLKTLLLLCLASVANSANTITYNQYKYVGLRNTWHDGTAHEVYFTKTLFWDFWINIKSDYKWLNMALSTVRFGFSWDYWKTK
jgi:hypothetical protein